IKFLQGKSDIVHVYTVSGDYYAKVREKGGPVTTIPLAEATTVVDHFTSIDVEILKARARTTLIEVMRQYPDGINVAYLKHNMTVMQPAFNERFLGFSKFTKYLQSVPEIVDICVINGDYHAKPVQGFDD
ncbi:MAG: OST-HTH/LOTUS domain-containing protein, partial [Cyanobacteria bacterium P01_D01_bin.36]